MEPTLACMDCGTTDPPEGWGVQVIERNWAYVLCKDCALTHKPTERKRYVKNRR